MVILICGKGQIGNEILNEIKEFSINKNVKIIQWIID